MKVYEVLWIDDDFNKDFDRLAYQNGISLTHFKTSKEGMASLESGLKTNYYDAVILDGLAYNESEDEEHSIDGLINSLNKITELRQKKWFPVFVFTGELNKLEYKGDVKWVERFNIPIVVKGFDNKGFIDDLIKEVDKQKVTQLKHKYPNAFAVCDDNYLGCKQFERVFQLIKDIETPENITNQQDALLPMRKILEALFEKLHKIGLIPDEIQNEKGAINGASRFLAGNDYKYKYHKELIHPAVSVSIHHLINLTQDASHNEGNKLGVDTYLTKSKNTFLYQALCYSILEVLDFIKPYIDKNIDIVENKSKWELIKENTTTSNANWISGTVIRIASNGYGTFRDENSSPTISIMPSLVKEHKLEENQKVEVITMPSSDSSKTFIKEIKVS